MRLPPPRLTVRGLIVVVAMVGLMLGLAIHLRRRSYAYLHLAARESLAVHALFKDLRFRPDDESLIREMKWSLRRFEIYERASKMPWLPVTLESPGPG